MSEVLTYKDYLERLRAEGVKPFAVLQHASKKILRYGLHEEMLEHLEKGKTSKEVAVLLNTTLRGRSVSRLFIEITAKDVDVQLKRDLEKIENDEPAPTRSGRIRDAIRNQKPLNIEVELTKAVARLNAELDEFQRGVGAQDPRFHPTMEKHIELVKLLVYVQQFITKSFSISVFHRNVVEFRKKLEESELLNDEQRGYVVWLVKNVLITDDIHYNPDVQHQLVSPLKGLTVEKPKEK